MRLQRVVWLALACAAVGGIVSPRFASSASTDVVLSTPLLVADGCNHHCRNCGTVEVPKHDIVVHHSSNEHQAAHVETCDHGTCSGHECGGTLPGGGGGELLAVAPDADGAELVALIQQNPERLRFNSSRSAIQVYCAEGRLLASLPIVASTAAVLARAQAVGAVD